MRPNKHHSDDEVNDARTYRSFYRALTGAAVIAYAITLIMSPGIRGWDRVDATVSSTPYGIDENDKALVDVQYEIDGQVHTGRYSVNKTRLPGDQIRIWVDGTKTVSKTFSGLPATILRAIFVLFAAGGVAGMILEGRILRRSKRDRTQRREPAMV